MMEQAERDATFYGLRVGGGRLLVWSAYPDDDEDGLPEIGGLALYDLWDHVVGWPAQAAEDAAYHLADEYSQGRPGHYTLDLERVAYGVTFEDCYTRREISTAPGAINSLADLATQINAYGEDIEDISHRVYKSTSCGAWCAVGPGGVKVGSIVEGCDEGTEVHDLPFPFTIDEFWAALDEVEAEAKRIWDSSHGCRFCWTDASAEEIAAAEEDENEEEMLDYDDYGARSVDPHCKACGGDGICI